MYLAVAGTSLKNLRLPALSLGPGGRSRAVKGTLARIRWFMVPAFLYRPLVGTRRAIVAGFLQATSLTFIVAASQIGTELGLITKPTGAALIAAGLLSVLIFPLLALTILRRAKPVSPAVHEQT